MVHSNLHTLTEIEFKAGRDGGFKVYSLVHTRLFYYKIDFSYLEKASLGNCVF